MSALASMRGWKLGEIGEDFGHVHLRSGVFGVEVHIVDRAMCFEHFEHEAPSENCSCGFCAVVRPEPLILFARPPYSQLWEVELGGRILSKHDLYRSESQTVRRVHLNPICHRCRKRATLVCTDPFREMSVGAPRMTNALLASCEACVTERWWSIADLVDELGVEIAWAPPEHTIVLLGQADYH